MASTILPPVVFLDNAGTTRVPPVVSQAMVNWMNRGNPSSEYASAKSVKTMFAKFRQYLNDECRMADEFTLLLTSGGSESNCMIVTSIVRAYRVQTKKKPHIISSEAEHKSILQCLKELEADGLVDVTLIGLDHKAPHYGSVSPEAVGKAIRSNTCLVTIMSANNESGVINNVGKIGEIAQEQNVPFHTDAVQLFGKTAFYPNQLNVDAFSASFHKLHGPPGVGLLAIRTRLIKGYNLTSQISGTQNFGLRGGTENTIGIAGAFMAMKVSVQDRAAKLGYMRKMSDLIWGALSEQFACMFLEEYLKIRGVHANDKWLQLVEMRRRSQPIIIWVGQKGITRMPNVMLLSFLVGGSGEENMACGGLIRAALEEREIIVGTGSACNSASASGSHVVKAMGTPTELQDSVIRVSLSDDNTQAEIHRFLQAVLEILHSGAGIKK
jgi:cysteine desulfurase